MSLKKKKVFPKLKKKLSNFLTDESWKITKKDALGISAWVAVLALGDDVHAGHANHANHSNWAGSTYSCNDRWTSLWNIQKAAHGSWIVNWHYSNTPNAWYTGNAYQWNGGHQSGTSHWSHSSHANTHSNHWSWGWC